MQRWDDLRGPAPPGRGGDAALGLYQHQRHGAGQVIVVLVSDTYHLIRAGLAGGKRVPESV
ncbi:hypothetical protein AB0K48_46700, partial [Nonomuraea sp. NPDC055795]